MVAAPAVSPAFVATTPRAAAQQKESAQPNRQKNTPKDAPLTVFQRLFTQKMCQKGFVVSWEGGNIAHVDSSQRLSLRSWFFRSGSCLALWVCCPLSFSFNALTFGSLPCFLRSLLHFICSRLEVLFLQLQNGLKDTGG